MDFCRKRWQSSSKRNRTMANRERQLWGDPARGSSESMERKGAKPAKTRSSLTHKFWLCYAMFWPAWYFLRALCPGGQRIHSTQRRKVRKDAKEIHSLQRPSRGLVFLTSSPCSPRLRVRRVFAWFLSDEKAFDQPGRTIVNKSCVLHQYSPPSLAIERIFLGSGWPSASSTASST